jgi:hypothetical protein
MVLTALGAPVTLAGDLGGPVTPYVVYVQHSPSVIGSDGAARVRMGATRIYGTVVVEGTLEDESQAEICTGGGAPVPVPSRPCSLGYSSASPPTTGYGYPLAILAHDPKLAYPGVHPSSAQPGVGVTLGISGTLVNGSLYSAGHATFRSGGVNGSTVAWTADVQASAPTHGYVPGYGVEGPPPGFPLRSVDPVVLIPRTFIACASYSDDSPVATPCQ